MTDWIRKLDDFLKLSEHEILKHAGRISHKAAEEHAHREFAAFEIERRRLEAIQPTSDFDKAVEGVRRLEQEQPAKTPRKKPKLPKEK